MRVEVSKFGGIDVFADANDVCFACKNVTDCPLIEALQNEVTVLHYENVEVQRCGLFARKDTKCRKSG